MPITERDLVIVTLAMDNAKAFSVTRKSVEIQSRAVLHYVFDSSSDASVEDLCRNANALKYNRVPALGIYGTMNFAIKHMSSEIEGNPFILFLHAADSLANKDVIANILSKVDEEVDWFYCNYIVEDSSVSLKKLVRPKNWSLYKQLFIIKPIHHQALFVRISLLSKLNGFDESFAIAADWEQLCRLSQLRPGRYLSITATVFFLGGYSSINRYLGNKELLRLRNSFLKQTFFTIFLSRGFYYYRLFRLRFFIYVIDNRLSRLRIVRKLLGWTSQMEVQQTI